VPFEKVSEEFFDEFLNVHYKGVYFLTQKLLPHLREGGGIINISTGNHPVRNSGLLGVCFHERAVEVLTQYWARNSRQGYPLQCSGAGPVETDFNDAAIRNNPQ
jgi:NAD(P)-dependent dehydrogenase (short-subunit alcohol dehydrogenase family)